MMIEPKELLAPTAVLFAVIFAMFGFLFPRALALYRERRVALSEIDVPDYIKKGFGFKIGALGDSFLLFVISISLLILGVVYCPALLYRIANFYLGSQMFSSAQILSDFRDLSFWFGILSIVVLVAVLALFSNDIFFSEKRLPTLVRIYIRNVLGQRPSKAETDSLLPEAESLYQKGAFWESVLYGVAALELEIRKRTGKALEYSSRSIAKTLLDAELPLIAPQELERIVQIRNFAAHPSPETRVTKENAEEVLSIVRKLLRGPTKLL